MRLLTADVHCALRLLGSVLVDHFADVKPCVWPLCWANSHFAGVILALSHGEASRRCYGGSVLQPGWEKCLSHSLTLGCFKACVWQRNGCDLGLGMSAIGLLTNIVSPVNHGSGLPSDSCGDDDVVAFSYSNITWRYLFNHIEVKAVHSKILHGTSF